MMSGGEGQISTVLEDDVVASGVIGIATQDVGENVLE